MPFQRLIDHWEMGIVTTHQVIGDLLRKLTDDTYDQFSTQVPTDLMSTIKKRVDELPNSQEEWDLMRRFQIGMYSRNWTDELARAKEEADKQYMRDFRRGVEVFRART